MKSPRRLKGSARSTGDASVFAPLDRDLATLRLLIARLDVPNHVAERIDRVRSGKNAAEKLYVLDWANDWAKWAKKAAARSASAGQPKATIRSRGASPPAPSNLARSAPTLTLEAQNRRARAFLDERARRTLQQNQDALQKYLARQRSSNPNSQGKHRCKVCGRIALDWENHCSDDER